MRFPNMDFTNLSPKDAIDQQKTLAQQISLIDREAPVKCIAGIDVGFEAKGRITRAAAALVMLPDLHLIDFAIARRPTSFPYIPGLLSFREIPAILDALNNLVYHPDLLLVDGHGIAHPRKFGIACHLGLVTDITSIGVGKSRLVGTSNPLTEKITCTELAYRGETIGQVIQSKAGTKPLYVSPGHHISIEKATTRVFESLKGYRLPEPIRWAHRLASDPENILLRALAKEPQLINRPREHVKRFDPSEI
ncbi:MAG: deoxyribonuclease V [Pseudomonadota bacterium]|nr:deoxyribonuclease V [Pseudomonadota bacterium]